MAPEQVYPKKKQNRINRYKENGPLPPPLSFLSCFPLRSPRLIIEDYTLDTIKSIMDDSMGIFLSNLQE